MQALKLSAAQQEQLLALRVEHLRKLRGVYTDRQDLSLQVCVGKCGRWAKCTRLISQPCSAQHTWRAPCTGLPSPGPFLSDVQPPAATPLSALGTTRLPWHSRHHAHARLLIRPCCHCRPWL